MLRGILPVLILLQLQGANGIPIGGTVGEMLPSELPGPSFPAPTAALTHMAWPISHRQPGRYDAWPQLGYGTPNRTLLPCWKRAILHDHANGWPGLCMKLMSAKKYPTEDGCRGLCWNEPRCAVWQYVNQTKPGQCWVGFGENCAWRDGKGEAITVQAAQRIMHGAVRVLKNLSGWKINNLYKIGMYHAGDEHLSILRCKAWCYSDISCQYWQYGPGGCWVDAPRFSASRGGDVNNRVQYPLTTDGGASNTSSEALTIMWGEYIQHYCPPQYTTPSPVREVDQTPQLPSLTQTTPAPHSSAFSEWWIWCLVAFALCLCAAACAYAILGQGQGQSKGAKSRRTGRIAMSDYGDEDNPLVSGAPPPAPTMDYLNVNGGQPQQQDYQPWQQQAQAPDQARQCVGGMPETQHLADAYSNSGYPSQRQSGFTQMPPDQRRTPTMQAPYGPPQMQPTQTQMGQMPYPPGPGYPPQARTQRLM